MKTDNIKFYISCLEDEVRLMKSNSKNINNSENYARGQGLILAITYAIELMRKEINE